MQLKLKKLQSVVKDAMKKEKSALQLMRECLQVFGPSVDVSSDPRRVFTAVNDKLSIMESRGQELPVGSIRTSTLMSASGTSKEARKIAARLLPERYALKFLVDRDSSIRCSAAKRFSYDQLKESLQMYPFDDQLSTIAQRKKLFEVGLPKPKEVDPHLDIYGDGALGEVLDGYGPDDLTDGWYKRTAKKIYEDYSGRLDGNWKNLAVSRLCSSVFATSGVKIDPMKLHQELAKISDAEEKALEESYDPDPDLTMLFESVGADAPVLPVLEENYFVNPVKSLLSESTTRSTYINSSERLFNVSYDVIVDSLDEEVKVPNSGLLPEGVSWDVTTEKALDKYVRSWNERASSQGTKTRIVWTYGNDDKVQFKVVDR